MLIAPHACLSCYLSPHTGHLLKGCSEAHLPHLQDKIYFTMEWFRFTLSCPEGSAWLMEAS